MLQEICRQEGGFTASLSFAFCADSVTQKGLDGCYSPDHDKLVNLERLGGTFSCQVSVMAVRECFRGLCFHGPFSYFKEGWQAAFMLKRVEDNPWV